MQKLTPNTMLLRGSPHTLIHTSREGITVIDPGHGHKRAKQLQKETGKLDKPLHPVLLTHSHSDHSNNACKLEATRVLAHPYELPPLHYVPLRTALTFGLPLEEGEVLLLEPEPVSCAEPLSETPPDVETIPLPGHTSGQLGFLVEDHILYAGDSLFGDQVINRYGVLYHMDTFTAIETLEKTLLPRAEEGLLIIPSHGPPSRGPEAVKLIDANLERLRDTVEAVKQMLTQTPLSIPQISAGLHKRYGVKPSPSSSLLFETGIRGILAGLLQRGDAEPVIIEGELRWRTPA